MDTTKLEAVVNGWVSTTNWVRWNFAIKSEDSEGREFGGQGGDWNGVVVGSPKRFFREGGFLILLFVGDKASWNYLVDEKATWGFTVPHPKIKNLSAILFGTPTAGLSFLVAMV